MVTAGERATLSKLAWRDDDGIPAGEAAFVPMAGAFRIARQADGSCVFLARDGKCKIHSRFGEALKPLGCRLYPFEILRTGDALTVGIRYDCPSAAANRGDSLDTHARDLHSLASELKPESIAPPSVNDRDKLNWAETRTVLAGLDAVLADESHALSRRLLHLRFVAGMLGQASFEKIRGPRVGELLNVLTQAAPAEVNAEQPAPASTARLQLRSLVMHLARKDTLATRGALYRLRMVWAGAKLALGVGRAPKMNDLLDPAPIRAIEDALPREPAADEALIRYARTKIQSLAYAGPSFYHFSIARGVSNLLVMLVVASYLARWHAVARSRKQVDARDVEIALQLLDAHVGRSPVVGSGNFQSRVRQLDASDQLPRLIVALLG
jgi:lysine-N-methylase